MTWDKMSESTMGKTDGIPRIERPEFEKRRRRLAGKCGAAGLDGAVVVSRGGTASDRAGFGIYLANYYSSFFPGLDDFAPRWNMRGHNTVVLTADGKAALVKDMNLFDSEAVGRAIDDVVQDFNVVRGTAQMVKELGLENAKLALIGSQILSVRHFEDLKEALPDVEWVISDAMLLDMMMIKSAPEMAIIRYGNNAVMEVSELNFELANQQGTTEIDIYAQTEKELALRGCLLGWLRPRTPKPIAAGAVYTQAIIGWCQGYFFDIGRSRVVQGEPTREQEDFLRLLREFAEVQTAALQVGRTFHDAAEVGMKYFVEDNEEFTKEDFEAGVLGTFASYGHSLGLAWSRPYLREGEHMVIEPGMYIQIEAVHGRPGLGMGEAELGVEITKDGPRMLSLP